MQPDIEIYIKDAEHNAVHAWLSSIFTNCSPWQNKSTCKVCNCDGISVTWYTKAVGNWHCLFFDSANTPWSTDLDCAKQAYAALGVEIRSAPGGWQEEQGEQDADLWLKINQHGCHEFIWRN